MSLIWEKPGGYLLVNDWQFQDDFSYMTSLSKFSWKTSPRDSAVAESRVEEIHNFLFEEISYEMRFER